MALLSGYEAARAKFEVDVIDLSMLTNFNITRATSAVLSSDPGLLVTLLGHSVWYVRNDFAELELELTPR